MSDTYPVSDIMSRDYSSKSAGTRRRIRLRQVDTIALHTREYIMAHAFWYLPFE